MFNLREICNFIRGNGVFYLVACRPNFREWESKEVREWTYIPVIEFSLLNVLLCVILQLNRKYTRQQDLSHEIFM